MTMKTVVPVPSTVAKWQREIAGAYVHALDAVPFAAIINEAMNPEDLFHLAPIIAIKMRGIKKTKNLEKHVIKTALANYVVNQEEHQPALESPVVRFSFCYLASHYALGLVSEEVVQEVMSAIEDNPEKLNKLIIRQGTPNYAL